MKQFKQLQLLVGLFSCATLSMSAETDQFTPPPTPLQDIGPEVTDYLIEIIQKWMDTTNSKITLAQKTERPDRLKKKLIDLHSSLALPKHLREHIGSGLPTSPIENWLNYHSFKVSPARHWNNLLEAPTVRIFGVYQGTDKISHFIQQGWDYFRKTHKHGGYRFNHELNLTVRTESFEKAFQKAIDFGVATEKSYFGLGFTGVYSNADLAANLAGSLFMENLTSPLRLNGNTLEAVIKLENGLWVWNPQREKTSLISPFISEHWDESLNPSYYLPHKRPIIRERVRKNCKAWLALYTESTKQTEEFRFQSLLRIDGIDYGHSGKDKELITISNTCF